MEEKQNKPCEHSIAEVKARHVVPACCIETPAQGHTPDYYYLESTERLSKAFDILFEEVDKMIRAGK